MRMRTHSKRGQEDNGGSRESTTDNKKLRVFTSCSGKEESAVSGSMVILLFNIKSQLRKMPIVLLDIAIFCLCYGQGARSFVPHTFSSALCLNVTGQ